MIRREDRLEYFPENQSLLIVTTFPNEIIPHFTSFIELLRELRDQQRNILRLPGHHQHRGDKKAGHDVTLKIEVNLH